MISAEPRSPRYFWAAGFWFFWRRPTAKSLAALRADTELKKGRSPPRPLKPLGFYEAEFVKTRCEILSFLFLIHFGRRLATNHLLGFWCLIAAVRGNERRKDQAPKSVTLSSA
jgi:hypothetical protein